MDWVISQMAGGFLCHFSESVNKNVPQLILSLLPMTVPGVKPGHYPGETAPAAKQDGH
jgi:hypothetical protein